MRSAVQRKVCTGSEIFTIVPKTYAWRIIFPRHTLSRPESLRSTSTASSEQVLRTRAKCRDFHTTPLHLKKGGSKASKKGTSTEPATSSTEQEDPNDFSELEDSITKAHTTLKESLSQLRSGGKFNPELVENLRVKVDKDSKASVKLGDLAQCVPRGRTLNVIGGEKDHVKAITSAILNSDLNLTPQPDSQNPLQLNIQLPTPTAESRQATVKQASDMAEKANLAIRNARGAQHKKLQTMSKSRTARPDDLKKAGDRMEKVVANGGTEVKRILDNAKKVLDT